MGKAYDKLFLQSLKSGVDPCGENGEFHTFCIAGPIFNTQLSITLGPVVRQSYQYNLADGTSVEKGFWFREILKAPI
jgi:diphthamide synthase (EF-2-diphthine--ammonia ligase)